METGRVAVVGGTGAQGRGLALRLAAAGLPVVIGSRSAARAERAAAELAGRLPAGAAAIEGATNLEAAARARRFVFLAVPYAAHAATLEEVRPYLAGRILVDVVVPLAEGDPTRYAPPPEGSATEQAQALLGPDLPVVAAFQNVAASALAALDEPVRCDVLVCGDRLGPRREVMALVRRMGCVAWNAGRARDARCVEALTPILIRLDRSRALPHLRHAGIRITG